MSKTNRKTLAKKFSNGNRPSQTEFGDLIDSMVNIVDDGFEKNAKDGMKVSSLPDGSKLISFYNQTLEGVPLWSFSFSQSGYQGTHSIAKYQNLNLLFCSKYGMTLAPTETEGVEKIRVGINTDDPQQALDVSGVIASNGRIGREGKLACADGEWHTITKELHGCQAFEIMAGVGNKATRQYALLHAFALSTSNPKKSSITYHQAHHSSKCDQMELRWLSVKDHYVLQIKTRCSMVERDCILEEGAVDGIFIRYFITELWLDPFMENCTIKGSSIFGLGEK